VRFSEHDVRAMGRDTTGVIGMKLRSGDEVISVEIARDDQELLVVTENGYGKRTRISEYPAKGRGTMGVLTIRYTESRGRLAGAMIVRDGYEVMLISQDGTVIRQKAEGISRMGRATQGVRIMNLRDGDRLSSVARVTEPQEAVAEAGEPADGTGSEPLDTVDPAAIETDTPPDEPSEDGTE
jgi:DNA gyrase subunit A